MPEICFIGRGKKKARTAVTPSTARPRTCPGHYVQTNLKQSAMPPAQHYPPVPLHPFDMGATLTDEQWRVGCGCAVCFLDVLEAGAQQVGWNQRRHLSHRARVQAPFGAACFG